MLGSTTEKQAHIKQLQKQLYLLKGHVEVGHLCPGNSYDEISPMYQI